MSALSALPDIALPVPQASETAEPAPRSVRWARLRRMTRIGRSTLLWAFLFYAVAQAVICSTLHLWSPRMPERVWSWKRQRLREIATGHPDRPLLVMFGTSRTEGALDADRLNGLPGPDGKPVVAYNAGVPTGGPMRQLVMLRDMLEAGVRPNLLLVEFAPPLLNRPRRGLSSEEEWLSPAWMATRDLMLMWPYLTRPARVRREWVLSRVAPFYIFRNNLHTSLQQSLSLHPPLPERPHDPWGRLTRYPTTAEEIAERVKVAREMYEESLGQLELAEGPCRAVRDLVACCRREQVPLVFVLLPESTEFRSWYRPEGLRAARDLLKSVQEEHGVPVIDGTDWLDDRDFVDGHHVQPRGAQVFTDRLTRALWPMMGWRAARP